MYAVHIAIENSAKSQSRRCEAVLEGIWYYDAATNLRWLDDFSPVNLRYDMSGPATSTSIPKEPLVKLRSHFHRPPIRSAKRKGYSSMLHGVAAADYPSS